MLDEPIPEVMLNAMQVLGEPQAFPYAAAVPPIAQTSLFTFDSFAAMEAVYAGHSHQLIYSRGDNPTVMEFERLVAALEGAEAGRGFASGMGAMAATILAFVKAGQRIVAIRHTYSDTYRLFEKLLRGLDIAIDYVEATDLAAMEEALPGAALLYLENPTSMTFELQDLARLAALARAAGAVSVIDNSWASPLFQQPIRHGVDLVVHAASKYLCGHSDVVAGIVVGSKEHIARINESTYAYLGAKLAPFEAWLLVRGLRTLPLRMAQHMKSGLIIAERLRAHRKVERVLHPAFSHHAGGRTLSGYSGLFAFELAPQVDVAGFVDRLRHIRLGVSWGGPESLIVPAIAPLRLPAGANSFQRFAVSPHLVRLHVGLEPVEAIWADLEQALAEEGAGPAPAPAP